MSATSMRGTAIAQGTNGDPVRMETAVSKFETLALMAIATWLKEAREKGAPE